MSSSRLGLCGGLLPGAVVLQHPDGVRVQDRFLLGVGAPLLFGAGHLDGFRGLTGGIADMGLFEGVPFFGVGCKAAFDVVEIFGPIFQILAVLRAIFVQVMVGGHRRKTCVVGVGFQCLGVVIIAGCLPGRIGFFVALGGLSVSAGTVFTGIHRQIFGGVPGAVAHVHVIHIMLAFVGDAVQRFKGVVQILGVQLNAAADWVISTHVVGSHI